jgi:hypothetical protein
MVQNLVLRNNSVIAQFCVHIFTQPVEVKVPIGVSTIAAIAS